MNNNDSTYLSFESSSTLSDASHREDQQVPESKRPTDIGGDSFPLTQVVHSVSKALQPAVHKPEPSLVTIRVRPFVAKLDNDFRPRDFVIDSAAASTYQDFLKTLPVFRKPPHSISLTAGTVTGELLPDSWPNSFPLDSLFEVALQAKPTITLLEIAVVGLVKHSIRVTSLKGMNHVIAGAMRGVDRFMGEDRWETCQLYVKGPLGYHEVGSPGCYYLHGWMEDPSNGVDVVIRAVVTMKDGWKD